MSDLFVRASYHPVGKQISKSTRRIQRFLSGNLFPIQNMPIYMHIIQSFINGTDKVDWL